MGNSPFAFLLLVNFKEATLGVIHKLCGQFFGHYFNLLPFVDHFTLKGLWSVMDIWQTPSSYRPYISTWYMNDPLPKTTFLRKWHVLVCIRTTIRIFTPFFSISYAWYSNFHILLVWRIQLCENCIYYLGNNHFVIFVIMIRKMGCNWSHVQFRRQLFYQESHFS